MRNRRERAFTLIELMVVIVILGALAALVLPNVVGHGRDSLRRTARVQMASLAETVELYLVRKRHLPRDLQVLAERDEETQEPFLRNGRVPKDPWGGDYEYRTIGAREFEIRSAGEDTRLETEDDLVWPGGDED